MKGIKRINSRKLLRTYASVMSELRRRGIVRSTNNPVADVAELLASRAFDLTLETKSTAGFDCVDCNGAKYQVKARRRTTENRSTQLSPIRNLDAKHFKYLLAILFDEEFQVERALRIPRGVIGQYARYSKHVNGHVLSLRGPILTDRRVEDVTARVRAVSL